LPAQEFGIDRIEVKGQTGGKMFDESQYSLSVRLAGSSVIHDRYYSIVISGKGTLTPSSLFCQSRQFEQFLAITAVVLTPPKKVKKENPIFRY
jgi:hypothetical protein